MSDVNERFCNWIVEYFVGCRCVCAYVQVYVYEEERSLDIGYLRIADGQCGFCYREGIRNIEKGDTLMRRRGEGKRYYHRATDRREEREWKRNKRQKKMKTTENEHRDEERGEGLRERPDGTTACYVIEY